MSEVDYFSQGPQASFLPSAPALTGKQHRHYAALKKALSSLTEFANEAHDTGSGITAQLCDLGWTYLGCQSGVRIFSLDSDDEHAETKRHHLLAEQSPVSDVASVAISSTMKVPAAVALRRPGVRIDEKIPYFRGEAWLPGAWRIEDVAATMASLDARKAWDSRFDPIKSKVSAHLNSNGDTLMRLVMHGQFPVTARDSCIAQTTWSAPDGSAWAVIATSVEDQLVPVEGPRPDVRFLGFFLRPMLSAPNFEEPPQPDSSAQSVVTSPVRPSHRRTRSNLSISNTSPMKRMSSQSSLKGMKPPLMRSSSAFGSGQDRNTAVPLQIPPTPGPRSMQTSHGMHVSYLVRASPGSNLPQTYVNALSVNLPLSLAAIQRYLSVYGFAPHVCRESLNAGLTILEEHFDPIGGTYKMSFRTNPSLAPSASETCIRFHGLTFRGHFVVEVARASAWQLTYDVPPASATVEEREEKHAHDHRRRRSSLSVSGGHLPKRDTAATATVAGASVTSPVSATSPLPLFDGQDPALLPGPQGGCTLSIAHSGISAQPVSVTITRKTMVGNGLSEGEVADNEMMARRRHRLLRNSEVLGRAAREAFERPVAEDLDSFIYSGTAEGRASIDLENAKRVLQTLQAAEVANEASSVCSRRSSVVSTDVAVPVDPSGAALQITLGPPKRAHERRRPSLQGIDEHEEHENEPATL